jgi:hypothetical protein
VALIVALTVFTIAGGRGRPWGERWLRGVAISGMAMFAGGLLHVPLLVTLALVLIAGLALPPREKTIAPVRPEWIDIAIVIPIVVVIVWSQRFPLADYDGRVFWVLKAKAIAHEDAIDGPFFRGESTFSPKNRYPLLVPLDAAALMRLARDLDDRTVRGFYALLYVALVLVIRRRAGRWEAAIVAWLPQFVINNEGGALTGYSDIALAAFAACALFDIAADAPPDRVGLWLAAMVLTKNEGAVYAAVLLAVFVIRSRRLRAAVPPLLAYAALLVWRMHVPRTDDDVYLTHMRLQHIGPAVTGIARHMIDVRNWGLFWFAVPLCLRKRNWMPAAVLAAMLVMMVAAYINTAWEMQELIDRSADRLLMQLIAPAVLILSASARSR